jgi:hypothetical protein
MKPRQFAGDDAREQKQYAATDHLLSSSEKW